MSARQIIPQTHDPCALCHKPNATKRCGRCRAVVYCSRDCQAAHWKRAHKLTCGTSPPPVPPRPQTPGELAEDCARQLAESGYAALGPLVDLNRRNALRTHARQEVERLLKLPLAAANARFAKIRSPEHRHAVALDLTPAVRDVVGELAVAYDACRAAFSGDEPEIVELGCLVSDAGAAAQPWHADADATMPNTRQLVLLVNLDERAVAATELLPGTHLCGNQISAAPRHRRDVVFVASARWRGVSTQARTRPPSTRTCATPSAGACRTRQVCPRCAPLIPLAPRSCTTRHCYTLCGKQPVH
jgi:hypothetical protein